jgi:hypothetical protein
MDESSLAALGYTATTADAADVDALGTIGCASGFTVADSSVAPYALCAVEGGAFTLQGCSEVTCPATTPSFLEGIELAAGSIHGGHRISIRGHGFSSDTAGTVVELDGLPCAVETSSSGEIICSTPATSIDLIASSPRTTVDVEVSVREVIEEVPPPLTAQELKDTFVEPGCDLAHFGESISCETNVYDPMIAAAFLARGYTDCADLGSACLYSTYSPPEPPEALGPAVLTGIVWSEFETPLVSRGQDFGSLDVGAEEFNRLFQASPNGIAKRWCTDCDQSHQQIFYKRLTDHTTADIDWYTLFLEDWSETTNNVMHTDFELYSTYADALAGTNAWQFCSYGDSIGFPHECAPGSVAAGSQWASFHTSNDGGKQRVTWFVEQAPRYDEVDSVPVLRRSSTDSCLGCIGDSEAVGLKGRSFTVSAWLSAAAWRTDANNDGEEDDSWLSLFSTPEDPQHNRLFIGLDGDNKPIMSFSTNRNPCGPAPEVAGLAGSTWAHVAWRYDIAAQTTSMFVNGELVASCSGRLAYRGLDQVSLGASAIGPYVGHLREIQIFEEPATAAQIAQIGRLDDLAWEWSVVNDNPKFAGCWKRSFMCVGSPVQSIVSRQEAQLASLADVYTYDLDRTPTVAGINRVTGTTAGGTTVLIYGENFGAEPDVNLSGINCATSREEIGEYRGLNLCDWGDMQRAQGKDDVAVDCSGLGSAPVCVATATVECASIDTAVTLSPTGSVNNGEIECEANPKCDYVDGACVAAAADSCAAAVGQSECEAVPGNDETCVDTFASCEGYIQCENNSNGRTEAMCAALMSGENPEADCNANSECTYNDAGTVGDTADDSCDSGRTCIAEETAASCPSDCTLAGTSGVDETCTNTVADCETGYTAGDATTPSDSCPTGCTLTPAIERGCTYYEESVTCLTNPFPLSSSAPTVGSVDVNSAETGLATTPDHVDWSYVNLWSAKTTWGGNDPPMSGDSVVVTKSEFIVLDISPPLLHLVILQGTLSFDDSRDLMFNASYIFVHGGHLQVGTESNPFLHEAYITIHGSRAAYEIPVYGAKCLGVRNGILDLHGRPDVKWTRLAATAVSGQSFIDLREPVQWRPNDLIVIASTSWDQEEAEPMRVARLTNNGYRVILTKPLKHEHLGDGWSESGAHSESCTAVDSANADACAAADLSNDNPELSEAECWAVGEGLCVYHSGRGWMEDGDQMEEYSAEVGLLTSNVRVSGDMPISKIEQFGTQIVWHARGDNKAVGRLSFVEVFNAGQGLKLGKYPVHFHMVGDVSKSFVRGISVHHVFNRAIAIHGVQNLRVQNNFIFDSRGHAVFLEDGTETGHTIEHTAVIVTRPVWSLLLVDQSPAAFWIVNPDNIVRDCAATSSHYGFWYRALEKPDGISGQEAADDKQSVCPQKTPLGVFENNVAHSVGKYGMKVSQYFPAIGGATCTSPTLSTPAIFRKFTVYKALFFGIWGENWVDLHFDGLKFADYGMAGIEPMSTNGLLAQFARTNLTNSLFVGTTTTVTNDDPREMGRADGNGFRVRSGSGKDACNAKTGACGRQISKFMNQADVAEAMDGIRDATQLDNLYVHAIHLPGTGSELLISDTTIVRHQAAIIGAAWVSVARGGYETEFEGMTLKNVGQIVSWTHKYSWILRDRDGSMAGRPGWIAPVSGVFDRNPDCHRIEASEGRYTRGGSLRGAYICDKPVRRVGLHMGNAPFDLFNSHYAMGGGDFSNVPKLTVTDITDIAPDSAEATTPDIHRMVGGICGSPPWGHKHPMNLPYGTVPRGVLSCLEQAPMGQYNFVVATGRKYLIAFYDRYDIFVSGGMDIAMFKMRPEEHIIFTMSHKAPFNRDRWTRGYTVRKTVEAWHIQGQEKLWDNMPASLLPVYGTGTLSGTCAAVTQTTPNLPDVTAPFKGIGEAACLISRNCRPKATNETVWTVDNCAKGKEMVGPGEGGSQGNLATQSTTAHGGFAGRATDGDFTPDWSGGSCTHTDGQDPWWQVDLGCSTYGCAENKTKVPDPEGQLFEVVGYVTIQARQDCCWTELSLADVYVSDTPDFAAGTLCARLPNVEQGQTIHLECAQPIVGRYVTIYSGFTQHLTVCEVQVFSCLMPNSGLLPGDSCTSIGPGPELASRPEFPARDEADFYPFVGE